MQTPTIGSRISGDTEYRQLELNQLLEESRCKQLRYGPGTRPATQQKQTEGSRVLRQLDSDLRVLQADTSAASAELVAKQQKLYESFENCTHRNPCRQIACPKCSSLIHRKQAVNTAVCVAEHHKAEGDQSVYLIGFGCKNWTGETLQVRTSIERSLQIVHRVFARAADVLAGSSFSLDADVNNVDRTPLLKVGAGDSTQRLATTRTKLHFHVHGTVLLHQTDEAAQILETVFEYAKKAVLKATGHSIKFWSTKVKPKHEYFSVEGRRYRNRRISAGDVLGWQLYAEKIQTGGKGLPAAAVRCLQRGLIGMQLHYRTGKLSAHRKPNDERMVECETRLRRFKAQLSLLHNNRKTLVQHGTEGIACFDDCRATLLQLIKDCGVELEFWTRKQARENAHQARRDERMAELKAKYCGWRLREAVGEYELRSHLRTREQAERLEQEDNRRVQLGLEHEQRIIKLAEHTKKWMSITTITSSNLVRLALDAPEQFREQLECYTFVAACSLWNYTSGLRKTLAQMNQAVQNAGDQLAAHLGHCRRLVGYLSALDRYWPAWGRRETQSTLDEELLNERWIAKAIHTSSLAL